MRMFALLFATLLAMAAPAAAQERNVGDTITYDVTQSGGGPSQKTSLVLKIDRVDPNGSAHAMATYAMTRGAASSPFDATFTSAGEIRPALSMDIKPHVGMSKAEMTAMGGRATGDMLTFVLRPFNTFAAACSARKPHAGDTWHASTADQPQMDFTYRVTRVEDRAGHTLVDVAMQSSPGAMMDMSGNGTYDVTVHLVTVFRSEWKSGGQSQVTELTLKP